MRIILLKVGLGREKTNWALVTIWLDPAKNDGRYLQYQPTLSFRILLYLSNLRVAFWHKLDQSIASLSIQVFSSIQFLFCMCDSLRVHFLRLFKYIMFAVASSIHWVHFSKFMAVTSKSRHHCRSLRSFNLCFSVIKICTYNSLVKFKYLLQIAKKE